MSHFVAKSRENFLEIRFPLKEISLSVWAYQHRVSNCDFALDGLIKRIRVDGRTCLLSRVTYPFARSLPLTGKDALHYAEVIGCMLVHSQVFVIQDLDGDRHYSLRMETLLSAPYSRKDFSHFLDHITQDVAVLIRYCRNKDAHPQDASSK